MKVVESTPVVPQTEGPSVADQNMIAQTEEEEAVPARHLIPAGCEKKQLLVAFGGPVFS